MRLSVVLASTVRALLRAEKGAAFLAAVDARLTAHRSGDAVGGDLRAAYWDGISRAAQKVQQKRSEIEQINALVKGEGLEWEKPTANGDSAFSVERCGIACDGGRGTRGNRVFARLC